MPETRQAKRRATTIATTSIEETSAPDDRPKKRRKAAKSIDASVATEPTKSRGDAPREGKKKHAQEKIDTSDFIPRVNSAWAVGAHVSALGGVENTVVNAASIGANAFALFVKSQRKWTSPPLEAESIAEFKKRMKHFGYSSRMVLPHGSYLVNLANPDDEKREKAYQCFLDDLKRCEALGLELYNFHPGSTVGATTAETSLRHVADCINRAHKETHNITIVIENMAGAGNIVGGQFIHLGGIIERVDDKTRVGVCLDTCHSFAAGYDIRTKEGWNATLTKFDQEVGLKYLRAMHLNDSKAEYNSKKDRHENIGLGHLGLRTFHHVLTDPRTQDIPLILETPNFDNSRLIWGTEISVLNRLSASASNSDKAVDIDLDALTAELKSNVKIADSKKPAKAKVKQVARSATKGKKNGDGILELQGDEEDHQAMDVDGEEKSQA